MAFWVVFFSASWAHALFLFFRKMGALGLFILGVCDSSFLFLPFGNDFLLIALVSQSQTSWQWVIYTLRKWLRARPQQAGFTSSYSGFGLRVQVRKWDWSASVRACHWRLSPPRGKRGRLRSSR